MGGRSVAEHVLTPQSLPERRRKRRRRKNEKRRKRVKAGDFVKDSLTDLIRLFTMGEENVL